MTLRKILLVVLMISCAGCGTTYRRSPNFDAALPKLKTIAVLPPDVRIFQISAGGVPQEMDEWSVQAKTNIEESLKKHLGSGSNHRLELKFITENWMKANQKAVWRRQKAVYDAIVSSAIRHTYSPTETFPQKLANFDYTMGPEVGGLAKALGADGLIFVNASDAQSTAGHVAVSFMRAVILGYYEIRPSFFTIALVDGTTGELLWFNTPPGQQDYNFLNPKHIDSIVKCVTKDFVSFKK